MTEKRHAPATERNRDAILDVLKNHLPAHGQVLELASGTGQHAVYFAPCLAPRIWQPSDLMADNIASISAWKKEMPCETLRDPIRLDASDPAWPDGLLKSSPTITAITAINLIHISPWTVTEGLMAGAGRLLPEGGVLYLYGPYKINGAHTAPSNEAFERWLTDQDQAWGVRDMGTVAECAAKHGLHLHEKIPMPANNFSLIFKKV
ncbi:SAM-dependent methyltransferase [Iodidimonas muriae]|uniref:SAM-dependent methyltransferase n=1 Tax=Iodidimonas muriae TaxID=261467 RepID=A0ABQ2L829_9PROT|nr:DUF938 domain-containing protein [Iodidimonas muriae]GER06401.1 SAM-dependent methyltransferase [Kordiimonadales bacterium JCM 17843]GGO04629.1 SAM-dependent methyltransferase [Iodidimonas muriae]